MKSVHDGGASQARPFRQKSGGTCDSIAGSVNEERSPLNEVEIADMQTTALPLRVSWDPLFFQQASAIAYGTVVDEWDGERFRAEPSGIDFLVDQSQRVIGFQVGLDEWDPDPDDEDVYGGPRFSVPALGLTGATAGEILLAAEARWGWSDSSLDAWLFSQAIGAKAESLELAADLWTQVIDTGDLKGVFGLGYTLYDLGRFHEAHAHLRHYTELCPRNSWAWCWYGKSLEAIGERDSAIAAYAQAVLLEEEGGMETDAPELLEELL